VDLINRFGYLNGFQLVRERFERKSALSVHLVFTIIRPFGLCAEFLTRHTVEVYFTPVIQAILNFLDTMGDEDLKKETAKCDVISNIVKFLKALKVRVDTDDQMKDLEIFRLRMILRMLQVIVNAFGYSFEIFLLSQPLTSHFVRFLPSMEK